MTLDFICLNYCSVLSLHHLLHSVEGGAGVEPGDLLLVEGVVQHNRVAATVRVLQHSCQRLSGLEVVEANDADFVIGANFVVVSLVGEGEGEHALFLQIRLVDPGK